jgi:hypothetical protein
MKVIILEGFPPAAGYLPSKRSPQAKILEIVFVKGAKPSKMTM